MGTSARSARLALFVSGDGGWNLGVVSMAKALVDQGAVVVGIDIRRYLASLRAQGASEHCQSPAADFENLSHSVQKQLGLCAYLPPVLVGYSSGATVAYAALAQAPQGTFAGAISMGFCADQDFGGYTGVVGRSADPLFTAKAGPVAKLQLDGLPLVEVAATHGTGRVAMLLTGDGGWAGLDCELAATLAANGTSVIALDSLRHFWRKRSPAEAADDVARVMRQYGERWHASEFWLIGYSFGADVLPFIATRLPRNIQSRIAVLALLGPGSTASFEVRVADWLPGEDRRGLALAPEIAQRHGAARLEAPNL